MGQTKIICIVAFLLIFLSLRCKIGIDKYDVSEAQKKLLISVLNKDSVFNHYIDLINLKKVETQIHWLSFENDIDLNFDNNAQVDKFLSSDLLYTISTKISNDNIIDKISNKKAITVFVKEINTKVLYTDIYFKKCYNGLIYRGPKLRYLICVDSNMRILKIMDELQLN